MNETEWKWKQVHVVSPSWLSNLVSRARVDQLRHLEFVRWNHVVIRWVKQDDLGMFDWDLTDRDQGIFDTKMMVFLWFKREVTSMVRKRVQNDLQQDLTNPPLTYKGANVRATLELDPVKRPWKKVQAKFTGLKRECAKLSRESFDILCRWQHRAEAR